jgi:hypothetical protein
MSNDFSLIQNHPENPENPENPEKN